MSEHPQRATFHVCRGKSCAKRGAAALALELEASFARAGAEARVARHDCFDLCKQACTVLIELPGQEQRLYTRIHPRHAEAFAQSLLEELAPDAAALAPSPPA